MLVLRYGVVFPILVYRYLISPLLPSRCRFYPTCSQYCMESILKKGIFKGGFSAIKRLSRCHPWSEGGIDYVS